MLAELIILCSLSEVGPEVASGFYKTQNPFVLECSNKYCPVSSDFTLNLDFPLRLVAILDENRKVIATFHPDQYKTDFVVSKYEQRKKKKLTIRDFHQQIEMSAKTLGEFRDDILMSLKDSNEGKTITALERDLVEKLKNKKNSRYFFRFFPVEFRIEKNKLTECLPVDHQKARST